MKTILNRIIITTIISPALILLTVSPAMAVVKPTTDSNNNTDSEACLHIITLRSAGRDGIASRLTKMNTSSSDRMKKIAADATAADAKLATARANTKKQFEDKIAKLELTAGLTNVQKQAIETYKTEMETAKTTRESAVDTARTNYRIALASIVTNQQTILTNAAVAYQAAFEKAFATATANCNKADMPALKTAVQTAHKDLETAISNIKISDKIKQLETTRNDAIKAAKDTFAKQAATFTETLKTALGE
jgi:hypothetical protein